MFKNIHPDAKKVAKIVALRFAIPMAAIIVTDLVVKKLDKKN